MDRLEWTCPNCRSFNEGSTFWCVRCKFPYLLAVPRTFRDIRRRVKDLQVTKVVDGMCRELCLRPHEASVSQLIADYAFEDLISVAYRFVQWDHKKRRTRNISPRIRVFPKRYSMQMVQAVLGAEVLAEAERSGQLRERQGLDGNQLFCVDAVRLWQKNRQTLPLSLRCLWPEQSHNATGEFAWSDRTWVPIHDGVSQQCFQQTFCVPPMRKIMVEMRDLSDFGTLSADRLVILEELRAVAEKDELFRRQVGRWLPDPRVLRVRVRVNDKEETEKIKVCEPLLDSEFEAQLATLHSMGFMNDEANVFLLREANGDVETVINLLLM